MKKDSDVLDIWNIFPDEALTVLRNLPMQVRGGKIDLIAQGIDTPTSYTDTAVKSYVQSCIEASEMPILPYSYVKMGPDENGLIADRSQKRPLVCIPDGVSDERELPSAKALGV